MSSFTVRVELHSAIWQDYDTLHQEMGKEGFSRAIRGNDGAVYQLPTAEYVANVNATSSQVLEAAKRAAARTGKAFEVIVAETLNWAWYGLSRSGIY
jgi:hypothetical protein